MTNPGYNMLRVPCDTGKVSDGFHTFDELYEFRKLYNALLFNEWALQNKFDVHKSDRHYDGELCFGGDWFIVVALLPTGQISNHYHMADWNLFQIPAKEKALYPYDGHTPQDCLSRIQLLWETKQSPKDGLDTSEIIPKKTEEVLKALEVVSNWMKQINM